MIRSQTRFVVGKKLWCPFRHNQRSFGDLDGGPDSQWVLLSLASFRYLYPIWCTLCAFAAFTSRMTNNINKRYQKCWDHDVQSADHTQVRLYFSDEDRLNPKFTTLRSSIHLQMNVESVNSVIHRTTGLSFFQLCACVVYSSYIRSRAAKHSNAPHSFFIQDLVRQLDSTFSGLHLVFYRMAFVSLSH
jgi:hypothetical protein